MTVRWQDRLLDALPTLRFESPSRAGFPALLPLIAQDARTGDVLMLGYVSETSLQETARSGNVVFFSRSKGRLWMKGEQSGNVLGVVDMRVDCDADTVLAWVDPQGPTCHRGTTTCFDEEVAPESLAQADSRNQAKQATCATDAGVVRASSGLDARGPGFAMLGRLARTIDERLASRDVESYTVKTVRAGLDRVLKKIGEEAGETIIAAKNAERGVGLEAFHEESADLLYHWLMACAALGTDARETMNVLRRRVGAPRRE